MLFAFLKISYYLDNKYKLNHKTIKKPSKLYKMNDS